MHQPGGFVIVIFYSSPYQAKRMMEVSTFSRVSSHAQNVVPGLIVHFMNFAYAKCVHAALSFFEIFWVVPMPLRYTRYTMTMTMSMAMKGSMADKRTTSKWTLSEMTIVDMEYWKGATKVIHISALMLIKCRVRFVPHSQIQGGWLFKDRDRTTAEHLCTRIWDIGCGNALCSHCHSVNGHVLMLYLRAWAINKMVPRFKAKTHNPSMRGKCNSDEIDAAWK